MLRTLAMTTIIDALCVGATNGRPSIARMGSRRACNARPYNIYWQLTIKNRHGQYSLWRLLFSAVFQSVIKHFYGKFLFNGKHIVDNDLHVRVFFACM